jgi:DNA-binding IclR family transcriptional regulator
MCKIEQIFYQAELLMPSRTVNSITKGADILRTLSDGTDRISDLSDRLSLSKSTAHRLLKSLETSGLVMQDPITRRYYLGSLILNLASKPIIAHQNLIVSAFEEMKYLRDLCRETVVLHVRIGLERICLEELQSLEAIKYTAGKGFVAPIYTGSAGKILLSELEENEVDLLMKNLHPVPMGPRTITDKRRLLDELKEVKKQGYAISFGERIPGSASLSVPIGNYICPVALSALGPDNRFSWNVMMNFLREMRESASRISKRLAEVSGKERGR